MNRVFTPLLLITLAWGCINKPEVQQAFIHKSSAKSKVVEEDTVPVDLRHSEIRWKGTKMAGAGKHEGTIDLQKSHLVLRGQQIIGGTFTIDMESIRVTDIPEHEPVPRKRLTDHLKSEDFFDVKNYPNSHFEITKAQVISSDSLRLSGNLTIRGVTRRIEFNAFQEAKLLRAHFTFNRFRWNIAYQGNWLDRTFVDKEIEMKVTIIWE